MNSQLWTALIGAAAFFAAHTASAAAPSPWRDVDEATLPASDGERVIVPVRYRMLALDRDALLETLARDRKSVV